MNSSNDFLIFAYDLPNEPTRLRVKAWRDIKKLGGVYPSLSFCILPNRRNVVEELKRLRTSLQRNGTALIMHVKISDLKDAEFVKKVFIEERRRECKEIAEECIEFLDEIKANISTGNLRYEELEELEHSLYGLKRWYADINSKGYAPSDELHKVERLLKECTNALSEFAESIKREAGKA